MKRPKKRRPWGSVSRFRGGFAARAGDEARTYLGTFSTEPEADAALAEAWEFDRHLEHASGPRSSLVGYGREWIEKERQRERRRSIDREELRFTRHIARAPFASWPLSSITQRDVQRWIRDVADGKAEGPRAKGQKRSRQTVSNILNLLRSILRSAVEDELLDVSPAAGVTLPKTTTTLEPFTYLNPDELEGLRTATEIPLRFHAAFVFAAYAGLRPGELWGLHWADVLLEQREIIVRHSRKNATKGGRVRRVPLLEPAREILARWRAAQVELGEGGGLVWPGPDGRPYAEGYDATWAHRAQTSRGGHRYTQLGWAWFAGIRRHVPLKSLRHTCACHLLRGTHVARGWIAKPLRLEEVQQWLGHASITTTERYYARLAPGGLIDVLPGVP